MPQTFDLVLKGGIVVNQDGRGERDIGINAGRIAAIGDLSRASAGRTVDCRGLHVLPGVIDTQVHFREPGLEHKEDLETGSRAAVMGGVTAVFEMPNTNPQTTTPEALADKVRRGRHRMHCDFAFWVGGTHENAADVPELERLPAAAGIKVFMGSSTGSLLVEDDRGRRRNPAPHPPPRRLPLRGRGRACASGQHLRVAGDPSSHPGLARTRAALVLHRSGSCASRARRARASTCCTSRRAEEMAFLAGYKDVASCEATPHHLTLVAPDCYERLGTYAQMNPPVRDARHRDGVWRGAGAGHRRRARLRPRAAHARGEGARPIPTRRPA